MLAMCAGTGFEYGSMKVGKLARREILVHQPDVPDDCPFGWIDIIVYCYNDQYVPSNYRDMIHTVARHRSRAVRRAMESGYANSTNPSPTMLYKSQLLKVSY